VLTWQVDEFLDSAVKVAVHGTALVWFSAEAQTGVVLAKVLGHQLHLCTYMMDHSLWFYNWRSALKAPHMYWFAYRRCTTPSSKGADTMPQCVSAYMCAWCYITHIEHQRLSRPQPVRDVIDTIQYDGPCASGGQAAMSTQAENRPPCAGCTKSTCSKEYRQRYDAGVIPSST
jgi:hypothetical protein